MTEPARVRWYEEIGDGYVLGLVRAALGVLLFWQALGAAQDLRNGYFGDHFHVPMIPEAFVAPGNVYLGIVAARLILAAMVAVGHRARLALFASALFAFYEILCDRLQYHHNRWALVCFSVLVALGPCDRSFSITQGASSAPQRAGPMWPQRLAQLQLSLIYLASGGSKLLDDDWRGGLVLGDRLARYGHQAIARGVPKAIVELLSEPWASSALAKGAIATELFLMFGLWNTKTRIFALWWGVLFHLTIEATSKVEAFTWLTLAIYALFATPDVGARKLYFDPSRAKGVVFSRLVALFDWLARFDVRAWEPDDLKRGHSIVIVRRDGTRATGIRALAMVTRCLPILFPIWAPVALIASFTKGGETSSRA
jgi:hypothetical protein